jgi:hypothetical protein
MVCCVNKSRERAFGLAGVYSVSLEGSLNMVGLGRVGWGVRRVRRMKRKWL